MKGKRGIGERGEAQAAAFLVAQGLVVLEQNFYVQGGEIDLVCEQDDELVFVEVKLRNSDAFGSAVESVTPKKLACVQLAAEEWLQKNDKEDQPWRIDLIAIQNGQIEWLQHFGS